MLATFVSNNISRRIESERERENEMCTCCVKATYRGRGRVRAREARDTTRHATREGILHTYLCIYVALLCCVCLQQQPTRHESRDV